MPKRSYTLAEKIHGLKVYDLCEGNLSAAARELNMPRMTLKQWVTNRAQIDAMRVTEYSSDDERLTAKQEKFVEEWINRGTGDTQADVAARAGYSGDAHTLSEIARQNLKKVEIQKKIEARAFSAASLTKTEVIGTLTEQMRGDLTECFNDSGFFSLDRAIERGVTHLIKKIKYDQWGSVSEIEFHNQQSAAIQLCKVLGIERQPAVNDDDRKRWEATAQRLAEKYKKSREEVVRDIIERKPEAAQYLM